jgi:hypothetical protein
MNGERIVSGNSYEKQYRNVVKRIGESDVRESRYTKEWFPWIQKEKSSDPGVSTVPGTNVV